MAAVRALGKTRDLDNVRVLIYALTDPDREVVRAANEGLLRISRSPSLVRLPDNPTDEDRRAVDRKMEGLVSGDPAQRGSGPVSTVSHT